MEKDFNDDKMVTTGSAKGKVRLSVIVPITERHDDIGEIYSEYSAELSRLFDDYEMIFVVSGDFDDAYRTLKSLKEEGNTLTIIKHAKPFGESAALSDGFKHSKGEIIVTLPAYHQVDISELGKMIEKIEDADMVIARRWPRKDSNLNQMQTKLFNFLIHYLTKVKISDIGCGVRVMRREVLNEINLYGDLHRFLPLLADKQGFRIEELEIRQSPREKYMRTYSAGVYLRRLIDLLTVFFLVKFTKKPLRFFGLTGTAILFPGLILNLYLVFNRIVFHVGLSNRPLFLLSILLIVLGIQIFAIGLVGEIIIFTHAKELKEYTIEEIIE